MGGGMKVNCGLSPADVGTHSRYITHSLHTQRCFVNYLPWMLQLIHTLPERFDTGYILNTAQTLHITRTKTYLGYYRKIINCNIGMLLAEGQKGEDQWKRTKAKIDEEGERSAVRRGKHDIRLSVYSHAVLLNRSSSHIYYQYIRMISDGSFDTEDQNMLKILLRHHSNKLHFKIY